MKNRIVGTYNSLVAGALAVVLAASLLTGCGSGRVSDLREGFLNACDKLYNAQLGYMPRENYTVVYSQISTDTAFDQKLYKEIEQYGEIRGITVRAADAAGSSEQQLGDIDRMIAEHTDAVIINAEGNEQSAAALQVCADAGVPIFTVERRIDNPYITASVTVDEREMGSIAGNKLLEECGDAGASGIILELQTSPDDVSLSGIRSGFENAVTAATGVTVVRSNYCGYSRETARLSTAEFLSKNPDTDILAIFGVSDDLALGAMDACKEAGRDDIFICSTGGSEEVLKAVEEGDFICTVENDPAHLAHMVVDNLIMYLNGASYEQDLKADTVLVDHSNVMHLQK